ncbi:MAG: hypothetical protein U0172_05160 [Nitrospiraceae bacterium]
MHTRLLAGLLLFQAILSWVIHALAPTGSATDGLSAHYLWPMLMYGVPLALACVLWLQHRWAIYGAAMIATIGLALDLATFVQGITHDEPIAQLLLQTALSAGINSTMIFLAGYALFAQFGQKQ